MGNWQWITIKLGLSLLTTNLRISLILDTRFLEEAEYLGILFFSRCSLLRPHYIY
jgi:hypothetical protein